MLNGVGVSRDIQTQRNRKPPIEKRIKRLGFMLWLENDQQPGIMLNAPESIISFTPHEFAKAAISIFIKEKHKDLSYFYPYVQNVSSFYHFCDLQSSFFVCAKVNNSYRKLFLKKAVVWNYATLKIFCTLFSIAVVLYLTFFFFLFYMHRIFRFCPDSKKYNIPISVFQRLINGNVSGIFRFACSCTSALQNVVFGDLHPFISWE